MSLLFRCCHIFSLYFLCIIYFLCIKLFSLALSVFKDLLFRTCDLVYVYSVKMLFVPHL